MDAPNTDVTSTAQAELLEEARAKAVEHEVSASSASDQYAVKRKVIALFRPFYSLQKERWEKTIALAVINEKARVAQVVAEAEESHPEMKKWSEYVAKFRCPCCLDQIDHTDESEIYLSCCENMVCYECFAKGLSLDGVRSCPFCRTRVPNNQEEAHELSLANAKEGQVRSMVIVARYFQNGIGCQNDDGEARYWYRRAAEQGDFIAQYVLGQCYYDGLCGLQQSDSMAWHYYGLSAAQGHPLALFNLGDMSESAGNYPETVRWFTLSAQGFANAQNNLGCYFINGDNGLKQSNETALYYFEKAAMNGHAKAQVALSRILLDAAEEVYGGCANLVGFSVVPRALWYMRAAAKAGNSKAISDVVMIEKRFLTKCGNCNVDLTGGGEEARPKVTCARCEAAVFCDLKCMVAHWNAGHKEDCVNCKELDALVESNKSKWGE